MNILVSPLAGAAALCRLHQPERILSLVSPEAEVQTFEGIAPDRHLVLRFHDISVPQPGLVAVDADIVRTMLDFAQKWSRQAPLLIHCWAGISRSTAAAFILSCQYGCDPFAAARALRQAAPSATPNILMVQLADELLNRGGRMIAAANGIGRGTDAAAGVPFVLALDEI